MYLPKFLTTLFLTLLLSGCVGDVTIYSHTEVRHYPSRVQEKFPRGEIVLACTTVAGVYEFLERGGISSGCAYIPMTAARYRSDFTTSSGARFRIIEFRHRLDVYYTFEERRWRRRGYTY